MFPPMAYIFLPIFVNFIITKVITTAAAKNPSAMPIVLLSFFSENHAGKLKRRTPFVRYMSKPK